MYQTDGQTDGKTDRQTDIVQGKKQLNQGCLQQTDRRKEERRTEEDQMYSRKQEKFA